MTSFRPGLAIFCILLFTSQSVAQIQHFGNLPFRETPYADFVGIHPITKLQATGIKHYEITYDEQGRPVKVAQKVGEEVIPFFKDLNIHYLKAPVTLFHYESDKEIRHFTDDKGDTISVDEGTTYREVFINNKMGQKEELRFENKIGDLVNNSWGIARYAWKVLRDGTVVEKRFDKDGKMVQMHPGLDFYVVHFKYRPDGFVDEMLHMGKDGKRLTNNSTNVARDNIEYTKDGDFKSWATFNADGKPVNGNSPLIHKGINYHDTYGNVIKFEHFDPDGNLMMSAYGFAATDIIMYIYNFISCYKFYDQNREMIENRGVAYVINRHDRLGNEIESRVYSKDNELTLLPGQGFAVVKNTFDKNHQLISSEFFDTNVLPTNRKDTGAAMVVYKYQGEERSELKYDTDRTLINQ